MVPQGEKPGPIAVGAWSPFGLFSREVDRLFDDVGRGWTLAPLRVFEQRTKGEVVPRLDMSETEQEIKVTAELPGMDEKDVTVTLEGDLLTLKGEKKAETEEKGKNFHRLERTYGSFQRVITLPSEVDATKVTAGFKKGVLTVTLAKSPTAQTRKIEVKPE
ncbi:MAG: Hsp20/alpha crystallin family protein [Elusimicrobia bacterium]|nr:Hsp20/alpha crystallin family protein [Elusimicrobiota bacterium]